MWANPACHVPPRSVPPSRAGRSRRNRPPPESDWKHPDEQDEVVVSAITASRLLFRRRVPYSGRDASSCMHRRQ
ncbi:hypothetical protein [Azospirillum melinis]